LSARRNELDGNETPSARAHRRRERGLASRGWKARIRGSMTLSLKLACHARFEARAARCVATRRSGARRSSKSAATTPKPACYENRCAYARAAVERNFSRPSIGTRRRTRDSEKGVLTSKDRSRRAGSKKDAIERTRVLAACACGCFGFRCRSACGRRRLPSDRESALAAPEQELRRAARPYGKAIALRLEKEAKGKMGLVV